MALLTPFESLWSSIMTESFSSFDETSRGKYHLVEEDNGSILYVSAPGYKSEDLSVEMQDGRLTVQGKPSAGHKTIGIIVPERIDLRFSVSPNHIVESAELADGVLAIKLAKTRKTEVHKIPVNSK